MSRFFITDVFATKPLSGNQLAVFVEGERLSDSEMQALANEMHFSESAFICGGDADLGFDVRIFTPLKELPFAGHPTLGAAFVLREQLGAAGDALTLNLGVGPVTVRYVDGDAPRYVMQQPPPEFGPALAPIEVAAALGVAPGALGPWPPRRVSTGLPVGIVALRSLDVLRRLRPPGIERFCSARGLDGLMVFAPQALEADHQLHARMFTAGLGFSEDAATGSAAGCLAAYLQDFHALGPGDLDVRMEQGYEMGRPSLLWLSAQGGAETLRVQVGGRVRVVAEGRLL